MNLGELIIIALSAMLIQNVILTQFLGICPFLGVSKKTDSAIGMGIAVVFVITLSTLLTWSIDKWLLVPNDLQYMRTIVFILVISAIVQFVEMLIKKTAPLIYKMLGIYLPLITTNCAVLGVALLSVNNELKFSHMISYSVGTSLGFTLVIYVFSTIRERLEYNEGDMAESVVGTPIALITAGIMAMAFFGLQGVL